MKEENKSVTENDELLKIVDETTILGKNVSLYRSIQEPLFEAKEIAGWLDIKNVSQMLKQAEIQEEEKGIFLKYTPGGNQKTLFITEDAMYDVLMQSRKYEAKLLRRQIKIHLKKIRLTGASFELGNEQKAIEHYFGYFSDEIKLRMVKELEEENKKLQQFYDDLLNTDGLYSMNTVSKELGGFGLKTLYKYLRNKSVMFYKDNANIPYQRFMEQGLFDVVESPCADGKYRPTTYATKKGLEYIRKMLRKDELLG